MSGWVNVWQALAGWDAWESSEKNFLWQASRTSSLECKSTWLEVELAL